MISYEEFEKIVVKKLKRNISSNKEQNKSILSKIDQSLFIVAGPGSGKTTVIVLKILKHIFVDDIHPNQILSTTFTRKAADELYSRILSWGDQIKTHILSNTRDFNKIQLISKIDFNQIMIGTIDSISEELLRLHKDPGSNLPLVIEEFVAQSAMITSSLLKNDRYLNKDLQRYLANLKGREKLNNPSKMSEALLEIRNRIYYDQSDFNEIYKNMDDIGGKEALDSIINYENNLKSRNVVDFPMLEGRFLKKLKSNRLNSFLDNIKIILVDEYQDTNLMQEDIYFTIAKSAIKNGGSITVVGDDDQSLYRFRGATVDLFTNFKTRAYEKLDINVEEINLTTNYRSSENIINLCNHFVELDDEYQSARVKRKPRIIAPDSKKDKIPILGLFRPNVQILSRDLSNIIKKLITNKEVDLKVKRVITPEHTKIITSDLSSNSKLKAIKRNIQKSKDIDNIKLKLDEDTGSAADIAILTFSPKETLRGNHMFPYYLKKNLAKDKNPIEVFNPRGEDLQEIPQVSIFCGLILECIDPNGNIQKSSKNIPVLAKKNMLKWRRVAKEFIKLSPEPHKPLTLEEFVTKWQLRVPYGYEKWPKSATLMELAYKLTTWIESLQDDVEGIVYLEAITQTIRQTGFFNKYSANIVFNENEKESIEEALWNIFIPIATGGVKIDESLLETLPNDRINIMSIHQSKGLEFPLVIVDVGSKFNKNNFANRHDRFPKDNDEKISIEDKVRLYSSLGESERSKKDRDFDDLTRLYFVAFSRAEDVLILIGLNPAIDGYTSKDKYINIPNIALGWNRAEKLIGFNEIYMI